MPATPSFGQGTPVTSRALNSTFATLLAGDYNFTNIKAGSGVVVISGATYSSAFGTSSYTTTTPHGFATGDTVVVTGITPSSWNRTATITILSSTSFFFSLFNGSTGGTYSSGGTATGPPSTLYVNSTNDRVGIGTSSPATKLDVNGTVTATEFISTGRIHAQTDLRVGNANSAVLSSDPYALIVTPQAYTGLPVRIGEYYGVAGVGTGNNDFTVHANATVRIRYSNNTVATFNSTGMSVSVGTGVVIKAIENRLVSGSAQSAAMYLGDGANGNTATGGIEVSWDSTGTNPIIGIGVTRDTNGTKMTCDYAGILRFYTSGTERLSITSSSASFSNTVNATTVVASGSSWRSSPSVNGAGISYPGATIGGGGANEIGIRWVSPNIVGTVDNVVSAVLGTVSDRRFKTNIETLQNGLATVKQLRPVTYSPLDVIGFDENNEIVIGDKDPYETVDGFIADEVEQVAPWLVQGGENGGYQSVNYALITPMLVKAIQELDQRLQQLETT